MNMNISGSGRIPAGKYDRISICGSGHLYGLVECNSFFTSGSSRGESIDCSEKFNISGSSHFSGNVKSANISISGSFSCSKNIICTEKAVFSGSVLCGNMKCNELRVSGSFKSDSDVEAEKVKINGVINCKGLLNAEDIEIKFGRGMNIGSIGGSRIFILRECNRKFFERLPLISSLVKKTCSNVCVESSIEGDDIEIEAVTCPRVTGRVVTVGKGCKIDLVQYSDKIEIDPEANVLKKEKI